MYEKLELADPIASLQTYDGLVGLAEWVEEAVVLCDKGMRIVYCNRIASAIFNIQSSSVAGKIIQEVLPEIDDTLFDVHLRWIVTGGEPSSADIPSPFADGRWLRIHCFPLDNRAVVMFRDITEDVQRYRLADVKAAIRDAMALHGEVGYVRLSVRGTIDRADGPFCDLIGLSEDRLLGVNLANFVARDDRPKFTDSLEGVLRDGNKQKLVCSFLSNSGELKNLKCAMVPLSGAYGAEGALILLTPKYNDEER